MEDRPRDSGFLPPEPSGPEPDLGEKGQRQQPHQDTTQPLPQTEQTQPYAHQPPPQGWPPPQQGYGQPQGYGHAPPPGWHGQPPEGWQQPGWQGHQQQAWQGHQQQAWPGQQPWQPQAAWATGPREPDNGAAVAGFSLAMVGGGLLVLSGSLSTIVSLGLSIAGIIYSRKGKAAVDAGKTAKQRGLAQAGFIIGIVSTVLSLFLTVVWILFFVLLATDESFRRNLENADFGRSSISTALSAGAVRAVSSLLS